MKKLILTFLLSICAICAQGGTKKPPEVTNMKTSGTLGVQLLMVGAADKFIEDWNKSNPPRIKITTQVKRYQNITGFIVFSGCTEIAGKCDLYVKYTLVYPGNKRAETRILPLWQGLSKGSMLILGKAHIETEITPKFENGSYKLEATVIDKNSGTVLDLMAPYDVVTELDE